MQQSATEVVGEFCFFFVCSWIVGGAGGDFPAAWRVNYLSSEADAGMFSCKILKYWQYSANTVIPKTCCWCYLL